MFRFQASSHQYHSLFNKLTHHQVKWVCRTKLVHLRFLLTENNTITKLWCLVLRLSLGVCVCVCVCVCVWKAKILLRTCESKNPGVVWYIILNTSFQFSNNIIHISSHFFTHTYFQKNWKLLFKHMYQTGLKFVINLNSGAYK